MLSKWVKYEVTRAKASGYIAPGTSWNFSALLRTQASIVLNRFTNDRLVLFQRTAEDSRGLQDGAKWTKEPQKELYTTDVATVRTRDRCSVLQPSQLLLHDTCHKTRPRSNVPAATRTRFPEAFSTKRLNYERLFVWHYV